MQNTTDKFELPLLASGQAQKELTHNEALTLIDALLIPIVESVAAVSVPANPALGRAWIAGATPSGAWAGHANALACWTDGGWRFISAIDGMSVWSRADAMHARFQSGAWTIGSVNGAAYKVQGVQVIGPQRPAIATPAGGTVIDAEARVALTGVLSALRAHGLIAT